jgi:hypothetical protein
MECEHAAPILVRASSVSVSLSHFPTNSSPVVVFTAAMAAQTFYLGAKCGGGAEATTQRRGGNLVGGGGAAPSQALVVDVSKDASATALVSTATSATPVATAISRFIIATTPATATGEGEGREK